MTSITAISGSLRKGSYNTALIRAARQLTPAGVIIARAEIGDIPLYSADVQAQGFPDSVTKLAATIRAADGVLIATPEYNYSIPGVLKNTIDWLSRLENQPFAGKPIALMGASRGAQGTSRAQYHLRQVFVFLDGRVMNRPEAFVGTAHTQFDDSGDLTDEKTRQFLERYLVSVVSWIGQVQT
jgi:chromate reductase